MLITKQQLHQLIESYLKEEDELLLKEFSVELWGGDDQGTDQCQLNIFGNEATNKLFSKLATAVGGSLQSCNVVNAALGFPTISGAAKGGSGSNSGNKQKKTKQPPNFPPIMEGSPKKAFNVKLARKVFLTNYLTDSVTGSSTDTSATAAIQLDIQSYKTFMKDIANWRRTPSDYGLAISDICNKLEIGSTASTAKKDANKANKLGFGDADIMQQGVINPTRNFVNFNIQQAISAIINDTSQPPSAAVKNKLQDYSSELN